MALGLGGEALHQEDDDEAAENRREQYQIAKPARPFADIGVVPDRERSVVERIVKEPDQGSQSDRA